MGVPLLVLQNMDHQQQLRKSTFIHLRPVGGGPLGGPPGGPPPGAPGGGPRPGGGALGGGPLGGAALIQSNYCG